MLYQQSIALECRENYLQANPALRVDIWVESTATAIGGDGIHARRLARVVCCMTGLRYRHQTVISMHTDLY